MKINFKSMVYVTLAILLLTPVCLGGCLNHPIEPTLTETTTPTTPVSENTSPSIEPIIDHGSISGHVYEADGVTPIAGARVSALLMIPPSQTEAQKSRIPGAMMLTLPLEQAFTKHSDSAGKFLYPVHKFVITTEDGSYSYEGVPAGEYVVLVQIDGYINEFYDGIYFPLWAGSGFGVSDTIPENYNYWKPEVLEITLDRGASLVIVKTNQDTPGVDFKLERPASISGYIYRPNGELYRSLDNRKVEIQFSNLNNPYYSTSTVASVNGSYAVTGLHASNYMVQAGLTTWVQGVLYHIESTDQAVATACGESIQGVNFSLPYYGSISGIIFTVNTLTPQPGMSVIAESLEGTPRTRYHAWTDENGYYTIMGLPPGGYRVGISIITNPGPSTPDGAVGAGWGEYNYYYVSMFDGTTSGTDATPVGVKLDQDTPLIDIVIPQLPP